jgi:hypothetical protein
MRQTPIDSPPKPGLIGQSRQLRPSEPFDALSDRLDSTSRTAASREHAREADDVIEALRRAGGRATEQGPLGTTQGGMAKG